MLNCKLGGGRVGPGCVLVNVTAPSVDVEDAILVNVTATAPVAGKGGLVYNAVHEDGAGGHASGSLAVANLVRRSPPR